MWDRAAFDGAAIKGASKGAARRVRQALPRKEQFTGGSACFGRYRGMKLWPAAVNEAGSLRQEDVIAALNHARIAEGPGGPVEMVPGQHDVRMNMYIAKAKNGRDRRNPGGPDESIVPSARSSAKDR